MVALPKTAPTTNLLPFRATSKLLATALTAASRIADRKSTMPMLTHVRFSGVREGMALQATDLTTWITYVVPSLHGPASSMACEGRTVEARAIADIVKKLSGDEITLQSVNALGIRVASATSDVTLIGTNGRDFPKVPSSEGLAFVTCDGARLKSMIERVLFAVCRDETRFHLGGVYLESRGTESRMTSTDGHRLTRVDDRLGPDGLGIPSRGAIIPAKAAKEIAKLLKAADCHVAIKDQLLFVKQGDWEIATKLIDAQFPPYDQVIPKDHTKLATVERKALLAALKRAKPLTLATRGVKLSLDSGKLTLTSDHPDLGTASESLKAESEWMNLARNGFEIGFNPTYLIEALDEIDCKHVTFAFGKELDPVLVRGTEDAVSYSVAGSKQLCVIMPMRI